MPCDYRSCRFFSPNEKVFRNWNGRTRCLRKCNAYRSPWAGCVRESSRPKDFDCGHYQPASMLNRL